MRSAHFPLNNNQRDLNTAPTQRLHFWVHTPNSVGSWNDDEIGPVSPAQWSGESHKGLIKLYWGSDSGNAPINYSTRGRNDLQPCRTSPPFSSSNPCFSGTEILWFSQSPCTAANHSNAWYHSWLVDVNRMTSWSNTLRLPNPASPLHNNAEVLARNSTNWNHCSENKLE